MAGKVWKLGQLRAWARELLDDPQGDSFPDPRLDLLLNTSYSDLVTEIQSSGAITGMETQELTVTPANREYELAAGTVHVMDVSRQVTGTARPLTFHEVAFSERNKRTSGYYLYWHTGADLLMLGFCVPEPPAMTVNVLAVRQQHELVGELDVPHQMPLQHRPLIALKAAFIAKINQKRDAGGVAVMYAESMIQFRSWMGHATSSPKKVVAL